LREAAQRAARKIPQLFNSFRHFRFQFDMQGQRPPELARLA